MHAWICMYTYIYAHTLIKEEINSGWGHRRSFREERGGGSEGDVVKEKKRIKKQGGKKRGGGKNVRTKEPSDTCRDSAASLLLLDHTEHQGYWFLEFHNTI